MTSNQIYQINVSRKRTNEEKNYRIFTYKGWRPPSCRNYPQIIVVNNCTSYIKPNQADCHENLHSTHHYGKVLRVILVSSFPCSLRQKIYKSQHIHQIYHFYSDFDYKNRGIISIASCTSFKVDIPGT